MATDEIVKSDQITTEGQVIEWVPEGTINVTELTPQKRLKIAIIGPPKGGKSRLAATAPRKKVFFIDPINRLASVSGMPDVIGKTYLEAPEPNISRAWESLVLDINNFFYYKAKGYTIPGTIVVDDIDFVMDLAMRKFLVDNQNNSDDVKIKRIAGEDFLYPRSFNPYTNNVMMVGNLIAKIEELGTDLIGIFHERAEEAEDSTPKVRKYTGKLTVHPPRAENFLPLFNELWRVTPSYDGKSYVVQVRPGDKFDGATCLNLDTEEIADIPAMLAKHNERTIQNNGKV